MTAILKLKYSPDFEAYNFHLKPFNYYVIHIVYTDGKNEILKTYTYYEDSQIESIINGKQDIILYKYNEVSKKDPIYFIAIKIEDKVFNFRIEEYNKWFEDFII